jgi:hypothetical protein
MWIRGRPAELGQVGVVVGPGLLRDDQRLQAEARTDRCRCRRAPGEVHGIEQLLRVARAGAHRHVLELVVLTGEGEPLLGQRLLDDLDALGETLLGLVHVEVELPELAPAGAAPDADERRPPAQDVLQHRHVLGHPQRVVPGQDDDHGADVDAARGAGEVAQQLDRVRDHRVRADVVLHRPQRVEAQVFELERRLDLLVEALDVLLRVQRRARLPVLDLFEAVPVLVALDEERDATAHVRASWRSGRKTTAGPAVRRITVAA